MREKLDTGDYSIQGFEHLIAVERKGLGDLFQSLGRTRDNFEQNLKRMQKLEWKALVIEATEEDVLTPQDSYSKIHPNAVRASIIAIQVRYNLHVYYARNKIAAENWILNRFIKYYLIKREGK
jgi:ERCC4-type nuclease